MTTRYLSRRLGRHATALVAGICAISSSAWAQAAAPSAAAPPTTLGAVSDPEIDIFAQTTVKLHSLDKPTPELMSETITKAGMSVERYNEIAARMQKDPAFQAKVNAALVAAQAGSPTAKATESSTLPVLPTSGVGATILAILDRVCLPMVRNDLAISAVGPRAGLKWNKRDNVYWTALGAEPFSVSVRPRGANQTVCNVQIRYAPDQGREIARALNIWTMHRNPEMNMVRNDVSVGADGRERTTLSWERSARGRNSGLVFERVKPAAGSSKAEAGSGTLLFSEQASRTGASG